MNSEGKSHNKSKIAIVVSHPIQHFCPQYVSFAGHTNVCIKIFFASKLGLEKYHDLNFNREISWGNLNLDKFPHEFLNGEAVLQSDSNIDAPELDRALSNYKPDLLITYGYFQKLQRRAHRWAQKHQVALAYISDSELRHKRNRLKELIKYPFLRRYFSKVNYFLTVGDANEAFYKKYGVPAKKMLRMHFPIDITLYEKCWQARQELRRQLRETYGVSENEIVLSVVGKLVSWKNQDHIIRALIELEKAGKIFHLFVIGSGEMQKQWSEVAASLVKSKVHFTGFVNIESLPAFYAATDIYVHPASVEPHSIAISEAIYMGCPVIISDTCGSYGDNDDVQQNRNGLLYSFGDISQLAALIGELGDDAEMRKKFSEYSHQTAAAFQQKAHKLIIEKLNDKMSKA